MGYAIEITGLDKSFGRRKALDQINLNVSPGEMVALIGPSGSGKSTLLRHIAGLIKGDRKNGSISLLGRTVQKKGRVNGEIRSIRSEVGFIFQQFNLVGRSTLIRNVLVGKLAKIPAWRSMIQYFHYEERLSAMRALHRVGLAEHAGQRASTLSGGQQQRAAIARAMEQEAKIILADEPIASLDPESARMVMDSLASMNREEKVTVLISLHQVQFAMKYCPRTIALKDGKIIYDGPTEDLSSEILKMVYCCDNPQSIMDGTTLLDAEGHITSQADKESDRARYLYAEAIG
jgi:phosphonate transport system ATP-binding protein